MLNTLVVLEGNIVKTMGLFNFKKKEKISHLFNLLAVALADGDVNPVEISCIAKIAKREGLSTEKINEYIQKYATSIDSVVPKSHQKRLLYLEDMVKIMMVDGKIDENEMKVCKSAAIHLGLSPNLVNQFVDSITDQIVNNINNFVNSLPEDKL